MRKIFTPILLLTTLICSVPLSAQWASDPGEDNLWIPADTYTYENESLTDSDGNTWYFFQHPTGNSMVEYRLQLIDKFGNKKFDDSLGMLVSCYKSPYTVINQHLFLDRSNNLVLAVHDSRNSQEGAEYMTYTAYKISPEGKMLWDEDGVPLNPNIISDLSGAMSITALDDNSIIFAWMRYVGEIPCIDMQRVSSDGKILWGENGISIIDSSTPYSFPYVVNAGSNQFILVFAKGSGSDLYARKIDFDGTPAWDTDTRIYRGGWTSAPLWTKLCVTSSGDGGVLVSWADDRNMESMETPYLSYIKSNGELGFSGASATGDVRLDWEDERQGKAVKVMPAPDGNGFYAYWIKMDRTQTWNSLVIQRISKSGELMWGDFALPLTDFGNTELGYFTILPAAEGELAAFYMHHHSYYNVTSHCQVLDSSNGQPVSTGSLMFTPNERRRSNLIVTPCKSEEFWVASWTDSGNEDMTPDSYRYKRINYDLTYGSDHISDINEITKVNANNSLEYVDGKLSISLSEASNVEIGIYNISGNRVATLARFANAGITCISCPDLLPGVYIAHFAAGHQRGFTKFIVK